MNAVILLVVALSAPPSEDSPAEEAPEPEAGAEPTSSPDAAPIQIETSAELGYHTREPLRSPAGMTAKTTAAPGVAITLDLGGRPRKRPAVSVFGQLMYRTGVGMRAQLTDVGSSPRRPRARSQSVGLDLGVGLWRRRGQLGLAFAIGYLARPFFLEAKLGYPGYAIHGPTTAIGLMARLGQGMVRLDLMPRAGLAIDSRRDQDLGPFVGGHLRLGIRVYRRLFGVVTYTEEHSLFGSSTRDSARFVTAGLAFIHPP